MTTTNEARDDRDLWTVADIQLELGLARATVYRLVRTEKFPLPLKLGSSSRWLRQEVLNWVSSQPRARIRGAAR